MKIVNKFHQAQYKHMESVGEEVGILDKLKIWTDKTTVDYWRHERQYKTIETLAAKFKNKKWLTVGDGRFGLDSAKLKEMFNLDCVLPTDISGALLKKGKELKVIEDYKVENAELLSFKDGEFDVVFCKEAYHHFPRAPIALYEMLRVSSDVVVLIEPMDETTIFQLSRVESLKMGIKLLINSFLNRQMNLPIQFKSQFIGHEDSGNFVYSTSIREFERMLHGLDIYGLAWKGFNDKYIEGCEYEKAIDGNPVFEKIKSVIKNYDSQCKLFPSHNCYINASIIIFKNKIDSTLKNDLESDGYNFVLTKNNPFIS